ncbi:MAG TPA: glycine--tRNA ligase subunit beta, partial [Methyloceanibacter sp.]|nr:glycine--tRNA ligase subunit beta [Methyloceanibacter sp.]
MPELLLELLSEEIPAGMQKGAAEDLASKLRGALQEELLQHDSIRTYVTPRRLTAVVTGLPDRPVPTVETYQETRRGPPVGCPEQALEGFKRSLGTADYELFQEERGKGRYWVASFTRHDDRTNVRTHDVLGPLIERIVARFPWPKSMRWGDYGIRWVRPLHSILCLFDGEVVPLRFGPIEAGQTTCGHRFLAPEPFAVEGFADYAKRLRQARVMLDPAERRGCIEERARALADKDGLRLRDDSELLNEVTGLVEWPVPLLGRIESVFMALPPEVLVTSMRQHQRFLALEREDGHLAPFFVVVANTEAEDGGAAIVAGNERVLRARLWDARFFWDQDRKRSLESRLPQLETIVFHARLGTLAEKTLRLQALAGWLSNLVPGCGRELAVRAASLCKADLVTGMVREFPELQGIMGRYYALHDGDPAEVADAIAEHYAPKGPNDRCPKAPVSVAVALADKLDTLAGFFAVGERSTGSKDPFAFRRAAFGIIRLVLENHLRLRLKHAFCQALAGYDQHLAEVDQDAVASELVGFVVERLRIQIHLLREPGMRHDLITAVFAAGHDDDLVRLRAKVEALRAFLATDDGANLLTAYRRGANIVRIEEKRDGRSYQDAPDGSLLVAPEEKTLFERLAVVSAAIRDGLEREEFGEAMAALASLRQPVDAFFDRVTVNANEPEVRENRLYLLNQIRSALSAVADFSLIEDTV